MAREIKGSLHAKQPLQDAIGATCHSEDMLTMMSFGVFSSFLVRSVMVVKSCQGRIMSLDRGTMSYIG